MSYRVFTPKTFLTGVGQVTVGRRYYACTGPGCGGAGACKEKSVPWDDWAGIPAGHKLTVQARRMVTLAGSGCSFDEASDKLAELCQLAVSNDVVRRVCDEEGKAAAAWLESAPQPAAAMAQAKGEVEFYSDGVKVNTVGGWREMRANVFAKRPAAAAATPARWGQRVLAEPTCRVAWAAIAASEQVGASWQRMLKHLGLESSPRLSVLADGARWIWDEAARRFKAVVNVEWVVDVYHVCEHLHDCAKALFGAGTARAKGWAESRIMELIEMQGPKFIERLEQERAAAAAEHHEALDGLIGYLSDNRDSLWYRDRLAQGLPIGSGLVEGTCKNMIGKRLKLNNARWQPTRADHMAALRCLHYSDLWEAFWASKPASKAA
jgi:hypothetical protein